MNFADEIKRAVTTREAAERYGLQVNRAGFCCCPIHGEKTPSMKIYDGGRGFHCFGCGASGDVIAFVRRLFSLSFKDALSKINDDFGLLLPIGEPFDRRRMLEIARADRERRRKIEERQKDEQAAQQRYFDALNEWIRLDEQKRLYRPTEAETEPHPLFIEALQKISLAEHRLEEAEIERYKQWMR